MFSNSAYDPSKTAFLRWQAEYLNDKKKNLKQLKSVLRVGVVYRPDLTPDKNQNYLRSLLFIAGFTLYICLSVIIRLYSAIYHGKKPTILTKSEIGMTFGALLAFAYLIIDNLFARQAFNEKKISDNEMDIISKNTSNDSILNKKIVTWVKPSTTVGQLIQFIDKDIFPELDLISAELKKFTNHSDSSTLFPLTENAATIIDHWNNLSAAKKSRFYESPLEQEFSQYAFKIKPGY